jgi:serine/threonine-protein kinase
VAIKTLRIDVQEQLDEERRKTMALRFEREAKVAGRLVHPHVVTLFDAGDVDGLFYLAFEFVDGPDLAARALRQPPLTLRDILRIGREAASALDAAHRSGIIHRDIKPSNLLLTNDGVLKIADFGIATLIGQGTHLTQTGSLIGTPQYLSPEQVKSELPLDPRSDLFSLGGVLYELLGGARPFEGGTIAALLYSIVATEPKPLGELRPDLPERLSAAVMRLLAKEKEDRFPTAAALGEELAAIERELVTLDSAARPSGLVPDQAPTFIVAPPPDSVAQAPTMLQNVPRTVVEGSSAIPPTRQLDLGVAPRRSKGRGLAVVAVLLLATLGALYAVSRWRGRERVQPEVSAPLQPPAQGVPRSEVVVPPTVTATQQTESVAPATSTATESVVEEYRPVGEVIIVQVFPTDAHQPVLRDNGLVRGPATSSGISLRPGRHRLEILAKGFETATLLVESRSDQSSPTELSVTLQRR